MGGRVRSACTWGHISSTKRNAQLPWFNFSIWRSTCSVSSTILYFYRGGVKFPIYLVSNDSVHLLVLLLQTLARTTSHYVPLFLISYHWQQGSERERKKTQNICQLVWALVILPLLLTIPIYINYSFWGRTHSCPCQKGFEREEVLRWDLIACVDAVVFQIAPLCMSVILFFLCRIILCVDNVLYASCWNLWCIVLHQKGPWYLQKRLEVCRNAPSVCWMCCLGSDFSVTSVYSVLMYLHSKWNGASYPAVSVRQTTQSAVKPIMSLHKQALKILD